MCIFWTIFICCGKGIQIEMLINKQPFLCFNETRLFLCRSFRGCTKWTRFSVASASGKDASAGSSYYRHYHGHNVPVGRNIRDSRRYIQCALNLEVTDWTYWFSRRCCCALSYVMDVLMKAISDAQNSLTQERTANEAVVPSWEIYSMKCIHLSIPSSWVLKSQFMASD